MTVSIHIVWLSKTITPLDCIAWDNLIGVEAMYNMLDDNTPVAAPLVIQSGVPIVIDCDDE